MAINRDVSDANIQRIPVFSVMPKPHLDLSSSLGNFASGPNDSMLMPFPTSVTMASRRALANPVKILSNLGGPAGQDVRTCQIQSSASILCHV